MIKIKFFILFSLVIFGCQQKPTRVSEESAQVFDSRVVLIDTRSALNYESFHIEGSENLLVDDFLILKNPKSKARIFDPDLAQTVERLAHKGIHPSKFVMLIGDKEDSIENKKWKWLLSYLEISQIKTISIDEVRKMKNPKWKKADRMPSWKLLTSEDFQNDLIKNKIPRCFSVRITKWDSKRCF